MAGVVRAGFDLGCVKLHSARLSSGCNGLSAVAKLVGSSPNHLIFEWEKLDLRMKVTFGNRSMSIM